VGSTYLDNFFTIGVNNLVVSIDDQNDYPLVTEDFEIYIRPGSMAQLSVEKNVLKRLSEPYGSECISNTVPIYAEEFENFDIKYSRRNCLTICKQRNTIDALGCYDMRLPKLKSPANSKPCDNKTVFFEYLLEFGYNSKCSELCPIECNETSYVTNIAYQSYPDRITLEELKYINLDQFSHWFGTDNITYDMLINNIAGFQIVFKDKARLITETPTMTIADCVGSVGGTLGFFLGAGLLTCVDIFELIIELICIVYKSGRIIT
jgi:ABC-type dipeptide/oligopeptide/nickel transport system permease subunit